MYSTDPREWRALLHLARFYIRYYMISCTFIIKSCLHPEGQVFTLLSFWEDARASSFKILHYTSKKFQMIMTSSGFHVVSRIQRRLHNRVYADLGLFYSKFQTLTPKDFNFFMSHAGLRVSPFSENTLKYLPSQLAWLLRSKAWRF